MEIEVLGIPKYIFDLLDDIKRAASKNDPTAVHYACQRLTPELQQFKRQDFHPEVQAEFVRLMSILQRWGSDIRGVRVAARWPELESNFKRVLKAYDPENSPEQTTGHYVAPTRIRELETLSSQYDTTKLVRMCEEINIANNSNCYMTIAMLARAIIDHVPPLLGCDKFAEVASNYGGTRSFKDSMKHLQGSMRKISDSALHTMIRKQESLPTMVQVNFSADLDVLLGEIVRANKE